MTQVTSHLIIFILYFRKDYDDNGLHNRNNTEGKPVMNTTLCFAPDKWEECFAPSQTVYILWAEEMAEAGFKAEFLVKTSQIDLNAKIKVTCWTEDDELLDSMEGNLHFNSYHGKVLIPFSIKSDINIYLEVQFPEYETTYESDKIPVRTSLNVGAIV